ncbi:MAG: ketoacyl-ACP synthase III [Bacteroidales bacterium]|nr:ketoacyl-ACP synthase III [Bacteroidales bacterium]
MSKINAAITGIGKYLPEYVLTNEELSKMVDTSDEWIMTRIGIKERRIMRDKDKSTVFMGVQAVKNLLEKTNTKPEEIDLLILASVTPDYIFPASSNVIAYEAGLTNSFSFDINAACSGFLFALTTASKYIETGTVKKAIVLGAEKMSSLVNYKDRTVSPIFGDGAAAVLLEPTTEDFGIIDSILHNDGYGLKHLHQKAGGSLRPPTHETIDNEEHFIYQEGQAVFKFAVTKMADISVEIMERNNLTSKDITWLVPHQANLRIIDATARRMGLEREKVMINIEKYGNTTAATIPLCLSDWESQLKKGDNVVLSAFGAGFSWGSVFVKWSYDGK